MGEYNNKLQKTAVQTLNEMMMKKGIVPQYECIHDGSETGDGLFTYRITCLDHSAIGSGNSKKDAKQIAARVILNGINENDESFSDKVGGIGDKKNWEIANTVGVLQILCNRENLPRPEYILIDEVGPNHAKSFTIECRVLTHKQRATGRMKKAAKHEAARKMISMLSEAKESMKSFLEQLEGSMKNPEFDDDLKNVEEIKETQKEQRQDDDSGSKDNVIPTVNSSSPANQALQSLNKRVKTINIAEVVESKKNKAKTAALPTGDILFQRKYIARKLNDLHKKLKAPEIVKTRDHVGEIYGELIRILKLLDVEPLQICLPTKNDKFMLAIYIPSDPQIIHAAVDDDEVNLKISVYRRVIETLLDSIRY